MQYSISKVLSGISLLPPKQDGSVSVRLDYTISGEGNHNGVSLPINSGESIEVPIPSELLQSAEAKIIALINDKYKNDSQ